MKYLLILVACVAFITTSFSQDDSERKTKFGIKTGLNLSAFSASINSNSSMKPGFHFGFFLRSGRTEKFHLLSELYFSSQGQQDEYVAGKTVVGHTVTTLNALNAPILFEFGRVVTFQVGPQFGFLVSGKEKGTINNSKVDDDLKSIMKGMDVGLVLGLGIHASEHLNLGARYNHGLTPVFNTPQNAPSDYPTIYNRVLHFYVGWSF